MDPALHLFTRHSRVVLAGIQGFIGMDARQVHAGMTIYRVLHCSQETTPRRDERGSGMSSWIFPGGVHL